MPVPQAQRASTLPRATLSWHARHAQMRLALVAALAAAGVGSLQLLEGDARAAAAAVIVSALVVLILIESGVLNLDFPSRQAELYDDDEALARALAASLGADTDDPFVGVSRSMSSITPDMAQKVRSEINRWKVDAAGRPVSWSTFLLPASSAGQAKLPIAAEVEGAPALRDDASGVSTFAWHAPGAAPDAACRLRALRTAGDGNCLLHAAALGAWGVHDRRRSSSVGAAPASPTPASPPTPSASPAVPATPPTPTDGHLGVGGDALGTGALLGPLRRRVAAVLASDKFAASLIDRLRVEEARESAALAAVAPEAALTEARSDDALRADLARAAADAAEPGTYLEKVHVYALALALRRPLVVYADPREHGSIAGVYLPDLLPAAQPTSRVPLALAYTGVGASGHFSSCCGAEGAPRAVPLADCRGERLPLRFAPAAADASVETWAAAASAHLDLEWRESAAQPDGCPVAVVSAAPADAETMMLPAALELRRRIVEE